MSLIQIDTKTCSHCGACAGACPLSLIDFQPKTFPIPSTDIESRCFRCGHCVSVCPSGSLTHSEIPLDQCPPIRETLEITPAQGEQFLEGRRSIRAYLNKAVPRDLIQHLIEISSYGATGGNGQEGEWLVIDNMEKLNQIEKFGLDWLHWMNEHNESSIFKITEIMKLQEKHLKEFLRGAPVLVVIHASNKFPAAAVDCVIASTYLELAAKSQGLGCCWAGLLNYMVNSYHPMQNLLSLPPDHVAYGFLMLGYSRYQYHRIPLRKPPQILWQDKNSQ